MRYTINEIFLGIFVSWLVATIVTEVLNGSSKRYECCCNLRLVDNDFVSTNPVILNDIFLNNAFCAHIDEKGIYYSFQKRVKEVLDGRDFTEIYQSIHNIVTGNYFCRQLGKYLKEIDHDIILPNTFWNDRCSSFIASFTANKTGFL
jgi:hypothetical protein